MSNTIALTLVQFDPVWEDSYRNMELLNGIIDKIPIATDLIILPEMFLTGFSMNVNFISQKMDGEGVTWMINKAIEKKTTVIGTIAIKDNNKIYNRLLVINPFGEVKWYDKRHLFRMADEHKFFDQGNSKIFVRIKDWNVLPLVCYDLRFPVWSRNVNCQYDLLVYVSNWPESRRDAYLTLLKARAIENVCYVAAVNRTGKDKLDIDYAGDSVIIDPKGNIIADLSEKISGLINCTIELNKLQSFRQKFPSYLDADEFTIST